MIKRSFARVVVVVVVVKRSVTHFYYIYISLSSLESLAVDAQLSFTH